VALDVVTLDIAGSALPDLSFMLRRCLAGSPFATHIASCLRLMSALTIKQFPGQDKRQRSSERMRK
jgi:hypothetical protein